MFTVCSWFGHLCDHQWCGISNFRFRLFTLFFSSTYKHIHGHSKEEKEVDMRTDVMKMGGVKCLLTFSFPPANFRFLALNRKKKQIGSRKKEH